MGYQQKSYKKFVATAATATLVASAIVPVASAKSFSDVTETNDHFKAIDALSDLGVISGYPDGSYGVNKTVTRSSAVKILGKWLVNAQGFEIPKDALTVARFNDLPVDFADKELVEYAAVVKDAGVFTGSNGNLNAAGTLTRQQMAKVLVEAFNTVYEVDLVADLPKDFESKLTDLDSVFDSFTDYVKVLEYFEITKTANNTFNPTGAVTRGQLASFLYRALNNIEVVVELTVKSVDVKDAKTLEVTLSDDSKHTVTLEKALEANKATEVTFTIDEVEYTATVTYVVKELKVESVSAINAKQITVKFSAPVDEATATNVANYVFSYDGTKYTGTTLASLLETTDGIVLDEKTNTVTFTFTDTAKLVNGKQLSLDVSDNVLSADKTSKVAKYTGAVTVFSDTKAPTLTKALVKGDKLELTFDEEIASGSITTIKVDDVTVFSTVGSATGSVTVTGSTVTVNETLAKALKAVGTHNVVVYGATDKATPANTSQVTTASYTIENDVTAPTVQTVRSVEGNSRAFDVVFSENVAVGSAIFDVKKGNHTFTSVSNGVDSTVTNPANGTAAAQYKVVYFDLKDDGKTNDAVAAKTTGNARVARVIFSDDVTGVTSSYVNPLYTTGENTTSLSVKVNGYKDTANLVGSEYNGSISLSKDLSAPVIKAGLDNKINASGQLEVKFNKPVNVVDGAKITVKDKDGMPRTATVASGSGTDTLVLNVAGYTLAQANEKAPFTVEFAQGAVQSVSEKIFNTALSVVINRTATGHAVVDGVSTSVASTLNPVTGVYDNVITITYPQAVDASAINLANYTLDNVALPANSKIEINNTDTVVKITLPEGFATVNNQKLLQISTNVKTKTGSAIVNSVTTKQPYSQLLSFSDNTQPTLVKAEYLVADTNTSTTTKRIKLTFNENLTNTNLTGNTDAQNDIEVVINGTKKNATISDRVIGDNELVVVVADDINISQATTINVLGLTATNTSVAIKDGKGNVAKASTATATTKVFDIEAANDAAAAAAAKAAEQAKLETTDVAKAATVTDGADAEHNQANVDITGGITTGFTVTKKGALKTFASSDTTKGSGEWVALVIKTGFDSIEGLKFVSNGVTHTFGKSDIADATAVNAPAGSFVLYIKADEDQYVDGRTIELVSPLNAKVTFTVKVK